MPVDASIPLGVKPPDQMQSLSSLMGVANAAQQYTANAIPLQERQAASQFMSNPANYVDANGNIDADRLTQGVMRVAPTTGMQNYVQPALAAQKLKTEATSALSKLTDENRTRIANTLSTIPPDAPPEVFRGTIDALDKEYDGRIRPLSILAHTGYDHASKLGPQAVSQFMQTMTRSVLPQTTQQDIASGVLAPIGTAKGTQLVQTKVGTGTPQGGTVGQPFVPPNQFVQTPTGRMGVGNTATGAITEPQTASSQPPVNFPQGENKETWADLQSQRTTAQQVANTAPVMHDINQTIVREAGKGLNTGTLGTLTQKLASATGFTLDPNDKATDYNILGKMLERSALTAAQSQGPHTNAGLEASVRANGSLDYTPAAIKKIAYLNDALVSGSELYRSGLEKAVQADPNGVFAKRNFDQQWSKVATPQVLRLKNAVDNGNQEEVQSIIKEVGGKGSKGAQQLHDRLTQMLQLAGQ